MKEVDIGRTLIPSLTDLKFEVYQEVSHHGKIADIVAVYGPVVWVIESKTTLSLALMEQAHRWRSYATYVSVAIPYGKRAKGQEFADCVLRRFGIGLMKVSDNPDLSYSVTEIIRPEMNRKPILDLRKVLTDYHKTYAEAGNSEGRRWTPFQQTCINIEKFVRDNPGCSMKELLDGVDTHYHSVATARCCIARWASEGVLKGVRCDKVGGRLKFFTDVGNEV